MVEFINTPTGSKSGPNAKGLVETRPPHGKSLVDTKAPSFEARIVDWAGRFAAGADLGRLGEALVVRKERERLRSAGRADLAEMVIHTSAEQGDGAGYDVLSFSLDGKERFIEVKTTAGTANVPFFISANELAFSKLNEDRFELWRVYAIDHTGVSGKFFKLTGDLNGLLQLDPICYRARPI